MKGKYTRSHFVAAMVKVPSNQLFFEVRSFEIGPKLLGTARSPSHMHFIIPSVRQTIRPKPLVTRAPHAVALKRNRVESDSELSENMNVECLFSIL